MVHKEMEDCDMNRFAQTFAVPEYTTDGLPLIKNRGRLKHDHFAHGWDMATHWLYGDGQTQKQLYPNFNKQDEIFARGIDDTFRYQYEDSGIRPQFPDHVRITFPEYTDFKQ
jgi:hypothetical protein